MSLAPRVLHLAVLAILGASSAGAPALAQTCPTSTWGMGSQSGDVNAASFDSSISDDFGSGRLYFEDSGDSLSMNVGTGMFGGGSRLIVRQTYVLVGGSPGTPVSFHIRWPVVASISSCDNNYLVARLYFQGDMVAGGVYFPPGGYCGQAVSFTADLPVTRGPGDPFTIVQDTRANLDYTGTGTVKTALRFEGLPPGIAVVSCFGDTLAAGPPVVVGVGPQPPLALSIDAVRPNPARGPIRLAISLPRDGPAMLRVMDVAGRIVATRILDAPAPSQRDVTLSESLAPGTYYLRLSQGMSTATRAVTVVP